MDFSVHQRPAEHGVHGARDHFGSGRFADAVLAFRDHFQSTPLGQHEREDLFRYARSLLEIGAFHHAGEVLDKRLSECRGVCDFLLCEARVLLGVGRIDEAIDALLEGIEADGNEELHWQLNLELSRLYVERGEYEVAERVLRELPPGIDRTPEADIALVELLIESKKYTSATVESECILNTKQHRVLGRLLLAKTAAAQGDDSRAREELLHFPEDSSAPSEQLFLFCELLAGRNTDRLIRAMEELLRRRDGRYRQWLRLLRRLESAGEFELVCRCCRKVLEGNTFSVEVLMILGDALEASARPDEAKAARCLASSRESMLPRLELKRSVTRRLPKWLEAEDQYRLEPGPEQSITVASQRAERPRLSLCMIVRDNERTLDAALSSIAPHVDEIVVVDTGSKDSTPDVASRYGARLFHFPWCDDFSAARNESLRYARGEWLFWMDSDDTIDAENGRKLSDLAREQHAAGVLGYVLQVHCPDGEPGDVDVTVVDHVKLFRNREDIRFEGRIHEQVLPSIRAVNGEIVWTDIFVVHSGADHTPAGRRRKQERDLRILDLDLRDRPEHPFVLFNLGMTYADMDRFDQAANALCRSILVSGPDESHVAKAHSLLVSCLAELGRHGAAHQVCQKARGLFPDDVELMFREGIVFQHLGRLEQAEESYQRVLATGPVTQVTQRFSSMVRGIRSFKTRQNLALVYLEMGRSEAAEQQWRKVIEEKRLFRPAWRGLFRLMVRRGRNVEAERILQELREEPALRCEGLLLEAEWDKEKGDHAKVRRHLVEAVEAAPTDVVALNALCSHLFEQGPADEAMGYLRRLIDLSPEDASTHFNIATILMARGELPAARDEYLQSLTHRPGWLPTLLQLAHVSQRMGQVGEAIGFLKEAKSVSPEDEVVRVSLARLESPENLFDGVGGRA